MHVDYSSKITEIFFLQAIKYCISACYFGILWDLHHLEELSESGAPGQEVVLEVKNRLHQFMDTMKDLLVNGNSQLYKEEVRMFIKY